VGKRGGEAGGGEGEREERNLEWEEAPGRIRLFTGSESYG
jgi:hypothetical protein